ncbi:MAG: hypothetical protein IJ626_02700 [Muribaculaceae bacterium]|nr:hypothetical protein [Muribaculaceae bacterium]
MKNLIAMVLIMLCAISTSAQTNQKDARKDRETKRAEMNEKLLNAKLDVLVNKLELTDEQKPQFTALYTKYDNELRATFSKAKPEKSDDVKVVAEQIKNRLDQSKKAIDVQKKYIDEFAKVLNARQLAKFPMEEKHIQGKLDKRRASHIRGDKGGLGHDGKKDRKDRKPRRGHDRQHEPVETAQN